jgi:hypothetical protein
MSLPEKLLRKSRLADHGFKSFYVNIIVHAMRGKIDVSNLSIYNATIALMACCSLMVKNKFWPAPGSEYTELGVLMEPEVRHGAAEVYAGVQA